MDGKSKIVRISQIKAKDIVVEIQIILRKKQVPLKYYRRIIRKIFHVAIKLPRTKCLLVMIRKALKG